MSKENKIVEKISASGMEITVLSALNKDDYISLTDIAKYKNSENPSSVITHWLSTMDTVDFIGLWEELSNPNFNSTEYSRIKTNESGYRAFTMTPSQWIKRTNAIGIISKGGKYSLGTFAHPDIAFEFASWISPEFKLYIIKDYQRLKESDSHKQNIEWNIKRLISKTNYKIHTEAIKENLILPELTNKQINGIYAGEADMLNVALFGMTAGEWKIKNPDSTGNMRDEASLEQLIILNNLETLNAYLVNKSYSQADRLNILRKEAISQLKRINGLKSVNDLKQLDKGNVK